MLNWLRNLTGTRIEVTGTASFPNVDRIEMLTMHGGTVNTGDKKDFAAVGNHVVDISSLSDEGKKCFREYANAQWEHMNKPKVERSKAFTIRGACSAVMVNDAGGVTIRRVHESGRLSTNAYVGTEDIGELITLLQAAKSEIGGGDG